MVQRLTRYDKARLALTEAKSVDEAKHIRDIHEALRVYAIQAKNKQLELDAAEIRIRAERRLGELIKGQKETVGLNPGTRLKGGGDGAGGTVSEPPAIPTLADAGIDKKLSSRAQKIAEIPEEEFEQRLVERRDKEIATVGDSFLNELPPIAQSTGNNEWYTPAEYIYAARQVLGTITLDPASNETANQVVNADQIYTAVDDGLTKRWSGTVWMNPPYSSELIGRFCDKLILHYKNSEVKAALVLVNNATETAWFQTVAKASSAICFPSRRVRFWAPNREAQALQGQAIIYFGPNIPAFDAAFRQFGLILDVRR